nr:NADH dehydrogenase subunit 6 [Dikraneurini sp. SL-2021a]
MKMTLMKIMMVVSSTLWVFKSPITMGVMLIMQTMMAIMLMNSIMESSWFTMITFLMMIGGLLILFSYMSSIASNEKIKPKLNISMMLMLMIILIDEMMIQNQINETMNLTQMMNTTLSLTKIYNQKSMMLTMMMIMYLLLSMVAVTKMVKKHKGPLREYMKYE